MIILKEKKQTIIDLLVWLFRTKYKINDCSNNITKHIPYLPYVFGQTGLSKQYRPRWDAAERGVSSGSTLFPTHPATFRHNIG